MGERIVSGGELLSLAHEMARCGDRAKDIERLMGLSTA